MHWEEFSRYANLCGLEQEETVQLKRSFLHIEHSNEIRIMFENYQGKICNKTPSVPLRSPCREATLDLRFSREFYLILIISLYSHAEKIYESNGWPLDIMRQTMKDIVLWAKYHRNNFGYYGLDWERVDWLSNHITGNLLQFGRLQCNLKHKFEGNFKVYKNIETNEVRLCEPESISGWKVVLNPGDNTINLHIPATGPLDIEQCKISLEKMKKFYRKYLPDYKYKAFTCYSWLLDRQFEEILQPTSNILKFQKLGCLFDMPDTPSDAIWRVFGEKGIECCTHMNGLQKAMRQFVDSGGKFITGGLFILV